MTKKDIKQIFKTYSVQLGDGTLEMIENHIRREVDMIAQRAKSGNFKRLTPEHFHYTLSDWGMESGPRKFTK